MFEFNANKFGRVAPCTSFAYKDNKHAILDSRESCKAEKAKIIGPFYGR